MSAKHNHEPRQQVVGIRRFRSRRPQRQAVMDSVKSLSFHSDDCEIAVHCVHVFSVDGIGSDS